MYLKNMTFEKSFFWVTKQLQYANEIDSLPSQTFILFKPQKRLKKKMEDKWKILQLFVLLITSQIAHESTVVKGIDWLVRVSKGKVRVVVTSILKMKQTCDKDLQS